MNVIEISTQQKPKIGTWIEGAYLKKYHPLGSFILQKPIEIDGQELIVFMPSQKLRMILEKVKEGKCRVRLANSNHSAHGVEDHEIFFDAIQFDFDGLTILAEGNEITIK